MTSKGCNDTKEEKRNSSGTWHSKLVEEGVSESAPSTFFGPTKPKKADSTGVSPHADDKKSNETARYTRRTRIASTDLKKRLLHVPDIPVGVKDEVRFCQLPKQYQRRVYNLSNIAQTEIEKAVEQLIIPTVPFLRKDELKEEGTTGAAASGMPASGEAGMNNSRHQPETISYKGTSAIGRFKPVQEADFSDESPIRSISPMQNWNSAFAASGRLRENSSDDESDDSFLNKLLNDSA